MAHCSEFEKPVQEWILPWQQEQEERFRQIPPFEGLQTRSVAGKQRAWGVGRVLGEWPLPRRQIGCRTGRLVLDGYARSGTRGVCHRETAEAEPVLLAVRAQRTAFPRPGWVGAALAPAGS